MLTNAASALLHRLLLLLLLLQLLLHLLLQLLVLATRNSLSLYNVAEILLSSMWAYSLNSYGRQTLFYGLFVDVLLLYQC